MSDPSEKFRMAESIGGSPLFNRVARRLGFGRGADADPTVGRDPLVWYAITVVAVELVGLQGYRVATGRPPAFVENPLWLLRPPLLLAAAVATQSLHRRYDGAVRRSRLLERATDPSRFRGLVPDWLSWTFVGLGVAFTLLNAVVLLTIPQIHAAGGTTRVVRFLVVTPFGYVPVLATFLATYVAVEVLVPRRLARSGIGLDYLDPEGLGGMRPIGELVKFAYYLLVVGLVAYAIATYGPHMLGGALAYGGLEPPGSLVNVAFTAVWAAGVGTMVYGIYVLHRYMAREKRADLHRLDGRARELIDSPWDIEAFDPDGLPEEYRRYRERVDWITATREYPATFTMWTQLAVGVVIPKAVQLVLSNL